MSESDVVHRTLSKKSPPFEEKAVPLLFDRVSVTLTFDGERQAVKGRAIVKAHLEAGHRGMPYFDLYVSDPEEPKLRPGKLSVARRQVDRASPSEAWVVQSEMSGEVEFEVEWTLPPWADIDFREVPFQAGYCAVSFNFNFSDRSPGGFLERYLPAPCDWSTPFELRLHLCCQEASRATCGDAGTPCDKKCCQTRFGRHWLTNADKCDSTHRFLQWDKIRPGDPFLHIETERTALVGCSPREGGACGCCANRTDICCPHREGWTLRVYSQDVSLEELRNVRARVLEELTALTRALDPRPGCKDLLIHYTKANAGMEYRGAMVANEETLRHELAHLWYGRGVWPCDADSAWLDEAVASWWTTRSPEGARPAPPDEEPNPVTVPRMRASRRARRTPPGAYIDGPRLLRRTELAWGGTRLMEELREFLRRSPQEGGLYEASHLALQVFGNLPPRRPWLRLMWATLAIPQPGTFREILRLPFSDARLVPRRTLFQVSLYALPSVFG